MAKALLGHVGVMDPRVIAEMRSLRRRVSDLESQLLRLQAENDALQTAASRDDFFTLEPTALEPAKREPALA